ncbi:hypothetical protein ACWGDE_31080 [Streptomyces sp. NPDC054956]
MIVATAAVTAGCVTVRPVGPAPGPGARPVVLPTGLRTVLSEPADGALPLGTLPGMAAPTPPPGADAGAPADAGTAADGGTEAEEPASAARERARARDGAKPAASRPRPPKERTRRTGSGRPAAAPAPAPATKARGSRPAPDRTYDMAPLCAAARGTVDPAIVALCH